MAVIESISGKLILSEYLGKLAYFKDEDNTPKDRETLVDREHNILIVYIFIKGCKTKSQENY